jgi:hypothetical protein
MAQDEIKHFGWSATEDRQPPGVRFYVTGKVVTSNGGLQPRLTKTVPQGINPAILLLDLTIEDTGIGTTDVAPRDVRYEEVIQPDQYRSITIRWEGRDLHTITEISVVH